MLKSHRRSFLATAAVAAALFSSNFAVMAAGAIGVQRIGTIAHPKIIESSGVIECGTDTNVFWTHNDGDGIPVLYGIKRSGESVAEYFVEGANVTDWEDIARDDQGNLYLADTGNNHLQRQELAVHQFPEPDPAQPNGAVKIKRSWKLRFPAEAFNCESLFIWKNHGYVISKVTKNARAEIYRFPLNENGGIVTLEKVAQLPVTSPVTGADISPDGSQLGLVCKSGAYLFQVDGALERAGTANPRFIKFREGQIEGCCFIPEGLLAVSEKREIFCYDLEAFRPKTN